MKARASSKKRICSVKAREVVNPLPCFDLMKLTIYCEQPFIHQNNSHENKIHQSMDCIISH